MRFFLSIFFLLQNLDYTHNTHFHIDKFIFYTINNILNENIIFFYVFFLYYESKKLECQEKKIQRINY